MMTEHSQETKIAILEAKVEHMMGHVKELTQRVRANEKVVASVSLLGVIACTIIGAGYFAPKAEACSMPLDGTPANCGPSDTLCLSLECPKPGPVSTETSSPDYYTDYQNVTVYDTREPEKWTPGSVIQRMREWKSEQNRTPVKDSINNALANLNWDDYGNDDPTEQEELLQLSSSVDRQGT